MGVLLPVGTRKGLFLLSSDDRRSWEVEGPLLEGWSIYHAIVDPRDDALLAATNNYFYGATVHRSNDRGKNWERAEEIGLPEDGELKLNATWHVEPGRESEPETLWVGGDPGVLFRSDDGGKTFQLNKGLFEHPTREQWQPGAGGMCTHSIQLVDGAMYIAISAAGSFRSEDGGETWTPINKSVGNRIGYHIRTGKHDVTAFEWQQDVDFADRQFGRERTEKRPLNLKAELPEESGPSRGRCSGSR